MPGRRNKSDTAAARTSKATARAPTQRWERRRSEILRTAEAVFAELGFAAATLEEVASPLDLRRASLAYYFDAKETLFDEVFREILVDHLPKDDGIGPRNERTRAGAYRKLAASIDPAHPAALSLGFAIREEAVNGPMETSCHARETDARPRILRRAGA